jgi:hypothetical protein
LKTIDFLRFSTWYKKNTTSHFSSETGFVLSFFGLKIDDFQKTPTGYKKNETKCWKKVNFRKWDFLNRARNRIQ